MILPQVENRVDNQVRAGFTASSLVCHPEGAIFLAISEKGLVGGGYPGVTMLTTPLKCSTW